ncbi:hypothetical protein TrVE_jg9770 [Triparma verrucosa]|uniref:Uncharacterized protein n=1 Tax=Triparma verrucosa TaxID=1606542 RepID=A0A9W7FM35_9STRA|nr:hypothetical protein TrVE_jg9770 [Triparma verrucosa]
MNKEYRRSFFSTETGGQMKRRIFMEGNDVMKAEIFASNKVYRLPIEDKVATWVKESWATWEDEKPEWFTDMWKASVPKEMIPAKKRNVALGESGESVEWEESKGSDSDDGRNGVREGDSQPSIVHESSLGQQMLNSIVSRTISMKDSKGELKVAPNGMMLNRGSSFDEDTFIREIQRQGSIGI